MDPTQDAVKYCELGELNLRHRIPFALTVYARILLSQIFPFDGLLDSPSEATAGTSTAGPARNSGNFFKASEKRRVLTTGNIMDGNLFEIYLDELHAIEQIVCLCQCPVKVDRLALLHGMHESWLELTLRYDDGYIKDFFGKILSLLVCFVP